MRMTFYRFQSMKVFRVKKLRSALRIHIFKPGLLSNLGIFLFHRRNIFN